jgi:hypothetical protein
VTYKKTLELGGITNHTLTESTMILSSVKRSVDDDCFIGELFHNGICMWQIMIPERVRVYDRKLTLLLVLLCVLLCVCVSCAMMMREEEDLIVFVDICITQQLYLFAHHLVTLVLFETEFVLQ